MIQYALLVSAVNTYLIALEYISMKIVIWSDSSLIFEFTLKRPRLEVPSQRYPPNFPFLHSFGNILHEIFLILAILFLFFLIFELHVLKLFVLIYEHVLYQIDVDGLFLMVDGAI